MATFSKRGRSGPSDGKSRTSVQRVAFRGIPAHRVYWAFRDISHARTGEIPYIQHWHFGVVIAPPYLDNSLYHFMLTIAYKPSGILDGTWGLSTLLVLSSHKHKGRGPSPLPAFLL